MNDYLQSEIIREEEKLRVEKSALDLQNKLLRQALGYIKTGAYPYDAMPYLAKTRVILKDISEVLKKANVLEKRLIKLTKVEKKLLKKEREKA